MEDIRLKTSEYELDGVKYELCCNMNVLADVQEAYNGNLTNALNGVSSLRSTLTFLAAMLTDAADTQGIKDEGGRARTFTAKSLGRKLSIKQTFEAGETIRPLILAAVSATGAEGEDETEKN